MLLVILPSARAGCGQDGFREGSQVLQNTCPRAVTPCFRSTPCLTRWLPYGNFSPYGGAYRNAARPRLPGRLAVPTGIDATRHREDALALCRQTLADHPLIVVSNRGPVEYQFAPDNPRPQPRRRSSTVSTALNALISSVPFSWVASAMGEGDRLISERAEGASVRPAVPNCQVNLRFVVTPRRAYHKFYNIFCNPLLWFLQHYMWSPPYTPNVDASVYDAWENGYVVINQAFAESVVAEAVTLGKPPVVMFHDYHLYLAPETVRRHLPDAV
ncbi:MAG: trehalose-6-phosphate synthase, partial [SAR202 cluster bacterium]|nr:trehalose-6-phosphate synthase [SAR202 cluster bacterium]